MAKVITKSTPAMATRTVGTIQKVVRSASQRQLGSRRLPTHRRSPVGPPTNSLSSIIGVPVLVRLHGRGDSSQSCSPGR